MTRAAIALALLGLAPVAVPGTTTAQQTFDVVIRGGRLLDGTGNPWYYADVGIRGDRIAAVGDLAGATARRTIDATGLYVAPGFIDAHTHAGGGLLRPELSQARPLLAQGITTVIINPDGQGPVDLVAQRETLERNALGVNVAQLIGHGSVRQAVLGMDDRAPSDPELDRMRALVRTAMEAGAFGLSSGPYYAPGSYAATDELIALAAVAAEYDGAYTSHIRDEADYSIGVIAALDEVIAVAREARLPSVATHLKALGPRVWGFGPALALQIEGARAEGLEVFADQYPYTASATGLTAALVPRWAQAGGNDSLVARLAAPDTRARIRSEMVENLARRGGAERLQFRTHAADPAIEGQTLAAVAAGRGQDPVDAAIAIVEAGGAGVVSFNMDDGDVEFLMRQPWTMTASDGDLVASGDGVPHPRIYGTFPRKLGVYARDRGVVDLGAAVRSMTTLPATVFRVADRGEIRPGMFADIVVFDLARLRDLATYQAPHQVSEGMVHVLVNGVPAVDAGAFTDAAAGKVLRRR